MGLSEYNGFTGDERTRFSRVQKKAIEDGILKPEEETRCIMCGQDRGIRAYHVENYFPERIVENSTPLCASCHQQLHKVRPKNPLKFRQYLEGVREIPSKPQYNKQWWPPQRDKILDSYNGFGPEKRETAKEVIENAIETCELKPLKECECEICGQDKGLREYHIEDYTNSESIIDTAHPVCWTCHQYIHRQKDKNPDVYGKYVEEVKNKPRAPVYIANLWSKEDD